jgi:LAS superfamily LD-carboxypeptidase LdcB
MGHDRKTCLKQGTQVLLWTCLLGVSGCVCTRIDVDSLSQDDRMQVESVVTALEPMLQERRNRGDLAALTFEELYALLSREQRAFLRAFANLDARRLNLAIPYLGIPGKEPELVVIRGQMVTNAGGKATEIPPQFLPRPVYEAYTAMVEQMKRDIGAGIFVESGYRSAAYQLYLFLYYLKNHDYSIRQTARFVAWPGYSEHGWPPRQAMDIITEQDINGQDNPADMEATAQYQWMLKNASRFGFELSYPKDSAMAFEPWHWRFKDF